MNNNDDLALKARAEFERWWEVHYHNSNPPRFGWEAYREDGGYKIDDDESELDAMWNAWQAAQNFLLAEREADKKVIADSVVLFETLRQRIAELESLLSAIGKSRPGGAYFSKWDSKINEVLSRGK